MLSLYSQLKSPAMSFIKLLLTGVSYTSTIIELLISLCIEFIKRITRYISLPKFSFEFICSLMFFIGSIYFTVLCQKYASNRKNENISLPDILHTESLNFSKYYKLTDIPINIYVLLLIFRFNKHIPKFLWMMSLNYFIRALSFSMTTLPKCGKMIDKDNSRSCSMILKDYITFKDTHIGHNNDLLPSGHVSFSAMFAFYANRYGYLSPLHNKILWSVNIINSIFIILTRCHYSIDVLYAYIISYLVYSKMSKII